MGIINLVIYRFTENTITKITFLLKKRCKLLIISKFRRFCICRFR